MECPQKEMGSEINVSADSNLIKDSFKLKDIEGKFQLKVEHYHNPDIETMTKELDLDREIIVGMGIRVVGTPKQVFQFMNFAL